MTQGTESQPPVEDVRRSLVVRHVVLSVLMWLTYALYWRVVLDRGVEREARFAGMLLALFVMLQVLSTAGWVAHNTHKARRHGTRRQARAGAATPVREDFLGRKLTNFPSDSDLRRVPVIVVHVEGDEKRFEAGLSLEPESRESR
jgi:hypothetical protein